MIRTVGCVITLGKKTERVLMESFREGAEAAGLVARVVPCEDGNWAEVDAAFDAVAMAGARTHAAVSLYRSRIERRRPVFYVDNGYLASRWSRRQDPYYRITVNAMQCDGTGAGDESRFDALGIPVEPWRRPVDGRPVLVAMQSDWWYEINGTSAHEFIGAVVDYVRRRLTRRRCIIRAKPATTAALATAEKIDWDDLHAVISHSSALSIEAILRGIPGIALGPCACRALIDPETYDVAAAPEISAQRRREFGAVLASRQWTVGEIRRGDFVGKLVSEWMESLEWGSATG